MSDGGGPFDPARGDLSRQSGARSASVTLRGGSEAGLAQEALDPANQSLADALRVTFRLIQAAMVVLGVIFVFSGFQSIKEGERGIRLLFGRVTGRDLPSGFTFSFPYPFGELVKVTESGEPLKLDDEFWPFLSEAEKKQSVEALPSRPSLTPGRDNSVITADEAIAHTRWSVVYKRRDIEQFAENIYPGTGNKDELRLIVAAVQRGVVQAVATTTIDELLKQAEGDAGSVADRARTIAQRMLDSLGSGVVIEQLKLEEKMPPLRVRPAFSKVQAASSESTKLLEKANGDQNQILNEMAGAAADVLIELIDAYETALRDPSSGPGEAERILATIDGVLEGRAAEWKGRTIEPIVAGEVVKILSDAERYRTEIVSQRRAEATEFEAKLAQFQVNPLVVIHRDWAEALDAFLGRNNVQVMFVPANTNRMSLLLSLDPSFQKEQERIDQELLNERANQDRLRRQEAAQFKTDTTKVKTSQ